MTRVPSSSGEGGLVEGVFGCTGLTLPLVLLLVAMSRQNVEVDRSSFFVTLTDEPKMEIIDNLALLMQTDQLPETPRRRRRPVATATRSTERGPLHLDPPLPILPINAYHEEITDDEDSQGANTATAQANPWSQI